MRLLPLNEDYWRHGIIDMKDLRTTQTVSPMTPIEHAVKTLNDVAALRNEIKHLEDKLLGDGQAENAPPSTKYGEPYSLLSRVVRATEDADMAMAEAREALLRISRALLGSE